MVAVARLIGGAGTGKTTELMRIIEQVVAKGVDPFSIGFCSFTRAARMEASGRAAEKFNIVKDDLNRFGWFKTIHSIVYRQLNVGSELLAGNAESREWFREVFGEGVDVDPSEDLGEVSGRTQTGVVLGLWNCSRNRRTDFESIWSLAIRCDSKIPDLEKCQEIVDRYEQRKTLDHRVDFVDILGRFAGYRFTFDGTIPTDPDGDCPPIPVWIFDEQQDTSRLLDSVCRRLVFEGGTSWCYLAGDPFQSIYGWNGAEGRLFMQWKADHEKITGKSFRCPDSILSLGERCIVNSEDYFDRKIAPADHEGRIDLMNSQSREWMRSLDPSQSVLLLARTNHLATFFANLMNEEGIPWDSTKGSASWLPPTKRNDLRTLECLQKNTPIDFNEWRSVVSHLPVKGNFSRGVKTQWNESSYRPENLMTNLEGISEWGATDEMIQRIRSGDWSSMIEGGHRYQKAVGRFDVMDVLHPKIRIGTIHSVKGAEADRVVLMDSSTRQSRESERFPAGLDEERRLAYVGVTRARKELIILRRMGAGHRMPIPV
mgnify:CR=1 FL=1